MKLWLSLAVAGLSVLGQAAAGFAAQSAEQLDIYYVPVHFVFDQQEYAPMEGQRAFIYQGSTYVPLRFVSYSLHKAVHWDGGTYTVTVEQPASSDKTVIDDYLVNRKVYDSSIGKADLSNLTASTIEAYAEPVHYLFDGSAKEPPANLPGLIINDTLYVPVRFFSEAVGQKIGWDSSTYTVSAQSQDSSADTGKGGVNADQNGNAAGGATVDQNGAAGAGATAAVGASGGGGQLSYDTIKADSDARIAALQSDATTDFYSLWQQYSNEPVHDDATKAKYKAQGETALAGYDQRFAALMDDLSAQLTANHYSTSLVQDDEQQYADQKATAMGILNGLLGKTVSAGN